MLMGFYLIKNFVALLVLCVLCTLIIRIYTFFLPFFFYIFFILNHACLWLWEQIFIEKIVYFLCIFFFKYLKSCAFD
jgi:hypothetical protein